MKTTIRTFSALLAGTFLCLGFSRLAERLDPIGHVGDFRPDAQLEVAVACIPPGDGTNDARPV